MPYDTLPPDTQLRGRSAQLRTRIDEETLVIYWWVWVAFASVAAVANLSFVVFTAGRRRLWRKPFNKYLVSLAVPDCVFSGSCAVSCALHATNGRWYGGSLHCDIQSVYVIFGITASIWMNAAIAGQIYRMARCAANMKPYKLPTDWGVLKHVLSVYLLAMVIALVPLLEASPLRPNAALGLACMPLESDLPSLIIIWTILLPIILMFPVVLVAYFFFRTYKLLLQHHDLTEAGALFKVFGRIFAVLLILWVPTGLGMWLLGASSPPFVGWLSGVISHVQGTVSVLLYAAKNDFRSELSSLWKGSKSYHRPSGCEISAQSSSRSSRLACQDQSSRAREQVQSLRKQAISEILATERTPMMVVPYSDFIAHGSVPRSSDKLQQLWQIGDITVFVSHRWWGCGSPASDCKRTVDSEKGYKFNILCRGLKKLARRYRLSCDALKIWIDLACIDQDDPECMQAGIESLISYASRSQFIIIPIFPGAREVQKFCHAQHPMDLKNYGERAWCRLEAYVFLCLGEITGEAMSCCGYGLHLPCTPEDTFRDELQLRGVRTICGFARSQEKLKPLMSGAMCRFRRDQLPSHGDLSVESDRSSIREIESRIQQVYCQFAILRSVAEQGKNDSLVLKEKQLTCESIPLLVTELQTRSTGRREVRRLDLSGNQLRLSGFVKLFSGFLLTPAGSSVRVLDVSDNQLGDVDQPWSIDSTLMDLLSSASCKLTTLKLGRNSLGPIAAAFVRSARTVQNLELDCNHISDRGARAIASLLDQEVSDGLERTPWQRIDLSCNDFSDVEVGSLLRAARRSNVALGVAGNHVSAQTFGQAAMLDARSIV